MTRYSGYGFVATQPDPPSGGTAAVLARNVSACTFSFNAGAVAARYGLVTLQLSLSSSQNVSLSDGGETVSLYQAVHVDNLP